MIRIDLSPEMEARLHAEARAHGLEVVPYIESLLEQALSHNNSKPRRRTQKQMKQFFEAMSANSEKIPQLPDDAFNRESFYRDHD